MNVLVVDDSTAMRMLVVRTLKQAGFDGHTIKEATNGAEALEYIQKNPVDVVLSDWNMPKMTGIELLEKLNAEGSKVKLGFVTTEATPEMRKRAQDAGARFLISKPFTAESFEQTLTPVFDGA